jgi:hypothetical protein
MRGRTTRVDQRGRGAATRRPISPLNRRRTSTSSAPPPPPPPPPLRPPRPPRCHDQGRLRVRYGALMVIERVRHDGRWTRRGRARPSRRLCGRPALATTSARRPQQDLQRMHGEIAAGDSNPGDSETERRGEAQRTASQCTLSELRRRALVDRLRADATRVGGRAAGRCRTADQHNAARRPSRCKNGCARCAPSCTWSSSCKDDDDGAAVRGRRVSRLSRRRGIKDARGRRAGVRGWARLCMFMCL